MKEKGLLVLDQQPLSFERNFKSGAEGSRTPVQTNPP